MSPMRGTDYYRITGAIVATEGADRVYSPGEAAELRHASVEASSSAAVAKMFGRIGTGRHRFLQVNISIHFAALRPYKIILLNFQTF